MTIQLRLSEIQGDRTDIQFEKLLGVGRGTITAIYRGGKPSSIVLIPLAEKLNVNLNWLLIGKGTKYFNYDINLNSADKVSDEVFDTFLQFDEALTAYKKELIKINENAIKRIEELQKHSKNKSK